MATALLIRNYNWKISPWIAAALSIVAALVLLTFNQRQSSVFYNFIIVPTTVSLLVAMTQFPRHLLFSWLGSDSMRFLGRISYAFYIVQMPLLLILDWLIASNRLEPTNKLVFPLGFVLNLLVAWVLYKFVEVPAHAFISTWMKSQESKALKKSVSL